MVRKSVKKTKRISIDELLRTTSASEYEEIEVYKIRPFKDYPFKIIDDDKMHDLVESIMTNGVLKPVVLRQTGDDEYEMISGYHRLFAVNQIGLEKILAIIKDYDDDEAVFEIVDSNLHREGILPSEKAFAYKMRYAAMRRQAAKSNPTSQQNKNDLWMNEQLAIEVGESRTHVHRYLRLTELIPQLLELVDKDALALNAAVEISYISPKIQKMLYTYMLENDICKTFQILALRDYLKENETITRMELIRILNESAPFDEKKRFQKIILTKEKLREYFPVFFTKSQMENVIFRLLEDWKKENSET